MYTADLTDSRCLDCQSQHCSVGSNRTVSSSIGPCHSCHRRTWWPWSRSSRKRLKYSYYNIEQLLTSKSSWAFTIVSIKLNEFRHWINVIISASLWDGGLRGKVFDNGSRDSGFLSPLSIYIIFQIELKILTMLGGKQSKISDIQNAKSHFCYLGSTKRFTLWLKLCSGPVYNWL